MKRTNYIRKTLLQVTFVASFLLIASCGPKQKQEDTKEVAEEQNEAKFDENNQEQDAQFLVNAAEINLEQIQLGQLAKQKGRTTYVKELGRMLEDAHSKLQDDLTALAKSKMITIPISATENAQELYKDLKEKAENDFDKAYADMMVNKHKDAIDAFEKASTDSNDADIKNWATVTLSDLQTHLDKSIECQTKVNQR